jgi:acetate kinase
MSSASSLILVINCGSSSLKFALFSADNRSALISGLAERLGTSEAAFRFDVDGNRTKGALPGGTHADAMQAVLVQLKAHGWFEHVVAIGHRVVNGGERFTTSEIISGSDMIEEIGECPFAPLHNPAHATGMRAAFAAFPGLKQVAVFDTAFHQTMKLEAYLYALPRKYYRDLGVRRYGAHGTSHRYVSGEAVRLLGLDPNNHGLIVAHLGNGASATAVVNGHCVDTSMGLTPLEGLVMGTRSGDIDFGALAYISKRTGLDVPGLENMVNRESGLLGISELSNDCRTLTEAAAKGHQGAIDALNVFTFRLARYVGALSSALPRLDALVFTGGIGENSAFVRSETLKRLKVLGFQIDEAVNATLHGGKSGIVSTGAGPIAAVVPTDEEWMIALDTAELTAPEAFDAMKRIS